MVEIFAPCLQSSGSELEGLVHTWSQRVNPTRWAQHPLPPTTTSPGPPLILGVDNSDALEPVGGASQRCCGRFSQSGGDALSSSSNYGEQHPGTSLGYDVDAHQNDFSPALRGQQDMATRRCVDSVWVCRPRIAAPAATTPTPYRCRLHHQLLPLSVIPFVSPAFPFVSPASPFVSTQQPHPLHRLQHRTPIYLT